MGITYTWKVTGIKTRTEGPNEKSVVQTYWSKIGTDENGITGVFNGATPFTSIDVPKEDFIPFENLSEEDILTWIKAVVVADFEEHVNMVIMNQIDEKINPPVDAKLPWE
jgi:hypothetical protein